MKSVVILANPSDKYVVGGAENQLLQLAVELSNKGKVVNLIGNTDHNSSGSPYKYRKISGNWARPVSWLKLFRELNRIGPEVLVMRVLNPLLPIYVLVCRLLGIKIYYFCAHDWEIESRPDKRIRGWRWRLFWIGIQFVDKLFVQNTYQLKGFRRLKFCGKEKVEIIRNLPLLKPVNQIEANSNVFTWIGSYRPHKRPEWVIEMARRLPNHLFEVVLDVKDRYKIRQIFEDAASELDNLTYVPGLPRKELIDVYTRSKAVLITSEGEGFPNVAIEAWSQGRPIISTQNNALLDFEDGSSVRIAKTISEFVDLISHTDDVAWENSGKISLELFNREFSRDKIVSKIIS